ncbi:MAG: isoprenyl transferase [Eubacteriales bacterium]|nr:isoprenyl transferase [Eubacteriales bacterium]
MDEKQMPKHVAIVMDGNGRWAKKQGLPRLAGHNAGMMALKEIVKKSSVLGIEHLTVYAFSTENWKRPQDEVGGIFKILIYYVDKELAELHQNNVKVSILGDYGLLPKEAVKKLEEAMERTKDNTGLCFHIALNYGGRDEILKAVRAIAKETAEGNLLPEDITPELFSKKLYTADLPDPDLVIRTSGELRLSNFLLWQTAYSELIFPDVLWPDFTPERLEECIKEYQGRTRRFGGILK